MEPVSTPRISANMLDSHVGKNVIIVGKVMQLRGESAVLDANGEVNAILNLESHLMAGNGAQIIGRVNPDLSVKVYNALDLGSNVDFQVAQSVVEVTQQYRDLFASPRPASAASYCSSSSEFDESSSSTDDALSQLAMQPNMPPPSHPITTQGTQSSRLNNQSPSPYRSHSSSSGSFSSTPSLINQLSQLVIEHDEQPSSQLVTAHSGHSPSSEVFSSTSSLDNGLSHLASEYDQPSPLQLTTSVSNQPWHPSAPRIMSPRRSSESTYYSSSSEDASSTSDVLDDVFSQPAIDQATQQSSQSTTMATQSQLKYPDIEPSECSDSSSSAISAHELEMVSPIFGSPSSTGKLSCPSPIQTPPHTPQSTPARSSQSSWSPQSPRSPRLYRTRSGSLASVAELRERRAREDELLNIVMSGIKVLGDVQTPSARRSIIMRVDEGGRWRINSIREPWGP
ncbi:replication factor A protein 3-domain-containing protein [Xylaria sp. FL0933]|nr:replication factor A protein 3-domain-containing protein [Xylaria sp. FL0933]